MAAATSTVSGSSYMYSRRMVSHVRTYNWPPLQLNLWIVVMLLCSASIMGVFGNFIVIQDRLQLPVPWYVSVIFLACFGRHFVFDISLKKGLCASVPFIHDANAR